MLRVMELPGRVVEIGWGVWGVSHVRSETHGAVASHA